MSIPRVAANNPLPQPQQPQQPNDPQPEASRWSWFGNFSFNPINPITNRAVEQAADRAAELARNNRGAIVQEFHNMANYTLLGLSAPVRGAFEATRVKIDEFLADPNQQRARELKALLEQIYEQENVFQMANIPQPEYNLIRYWLREFDLNIEPIYDAGDEWELTQEIRTDFTQIKATIGIVLERSQGTLVEATNHLIQTVNTVAHRLEQIPHRVFPQLIAPPAPITPVAPNPAPAPVGAAPNPEPAPGAGNGAAPPAPQAEQPADGTVSVSTIRDQVGTILGQIGGAVGQAASIQAAKSLATMMIFVFDQIIEHLEENQEHQHIIATINPLKQRLQRILTPVEEQEPHPPWTELFGTVRQCYNVLQQQEVFVQNIRIPLNSARTSPSATDLLLNTLDQHATALHIPHTQIETTVTQRMIQQEAFKLSTKAAAYAPIQFIRYILRLEETDAAYATITNIPTNTSPDTWNDLIKNRFNALIDRSNSFLATKWIAKALYFVLRPLCSFYTNALVSNSIAAFESWKNTPDEPTNPKGVQLIQQARKWLANLSTSYNEAADPSVGRATDLKERLEDAIQSPERNSGYTSSQLYRAVSASAFDAFGPRFQWRQTLCQHFTLTIPPTSIFQFLNPFLSGISTVCGWVIHTALFIPEWIANQCLRAGTHLALKTHPFLENNLQRTLNSFRSNTQTAHAMNKIVYCQLERVWQLLQTRLREENADPATPPTNSTSRQLEITPLVEYLLEVLNKSRYGTQDRLSNYLAGRMSVRDRAEKELDELFLPEILEEAVNTISVVLDSVLDEGSLNELLFNCLSAASSSMDAGEPVSPQEFAGREKTIRDLTDQILEKSIFHAIEEKFDFAGENQRRGVHQFTVRLKEQSTQTATALRQHIAQIDPNADLTADGVRVLRSAVEDSRVFLKERVDALTRAEGNGHFHVETKRKLNETSHQLGTHYEPIATHLNESVQNYEESSHLKTAENLFLQMQQALGQIQNTAVQFGAQLQLLIQGQTHAQILLNLSTQLSPLSSLIPNHAQMHNNINLLRLTISRAEMERRRLASLSPISDPRIRQEYTVTMNNFYATQAQIANLTQTLQNSFAAEIEQVTTRIANNRTNLQEHLTQLNEKITAFQTWTDQVHEIPIWNLFIIDMQGVTEFTKRLACNRAQEKVKKLREALYQRHNFIGLFNQASMFFLNRYSDE